MRGPAVDGVERTFQWARARPPRRTARGGRELAFVPDDPWPEGPLFFSLDLDGLDQAYAPGVSAMNPSGWTARLAARLFLAFRAGVAERSG